MFDALLLIWFLASVGVFVVSFQSGNTFSPWQKLITIIAIGLFGLFAISCLLLTPHFWKLFALTGIYHGLNVARLLKMRTEFRQLRRKVVVSYWKLWLLELLVFVLALNFSSSGFTLADLWAVLNVIMLLAVGFVLLRIILVKSKSKLPRSVGSSTDELPSVSVLIPARNEDHVLETCLNSLLDIDYPKLEIIVLDDCSQDQTSEIIARFAHAGVRFIKGNDPDDDWLGKNHALAQLADEASGELLIFSEVDVRFSANSITQIARAYQQSKFTMISILPQRYGRDFPTSWLYGLTDFWSLVVPTSLQNNTVSSESVFAIKASELNRIGGFEQHQKAINPVNKLARKLNRWGLYKFVISDRRLGITLRKRFNSVLQRGLRRAYPLSGSDPTHTLMVAVMLVSALSYVVVLIYDFRMWPIVGAMMTAVGLYHVWTIDSAGFLAKSLQFFAGILLPSYILIELYIQLLSLINYEFRELVWKERLVCYPIYREFTKTS